MLLSDCIIKNLIAGQQAQVPSGGYRWAFGDFDSKMVRALKEKRSMIMLYRALNPFKLVENQIVYDSNIDLPIQPGVEVPFLDEDLFRSYFAHTNKLDWVGESLFDQENEKQRKSTAENYPENKLSVTIDLSTFPQTSHVYLGLHLASGSGLCEVPEELSVKVNAQIVTQNDAMPENVKQKYELYQSIYSQFVGAEVSA